MYAGNQLIIAAARDTSSASSSSETYTRGLGLSLNPMQAVAQTGTRGGGTTTTSASSTARGVQITSAQGNVGLAAGGTALIEGAQLSADQGTVGIQAANVIIQAAVNTASTSTTSKTQGNPNINILGYAKPGEGFGRKLTAATGQEQTSLSQTTVSAQNVNITATQGDLRIAGTTVTTPGILSLNAAQGQIALDGQQTLTISTLQSMGKDLAYQRMRDQGSIEQTTHYNQFNARTVQFNAPNITAQIGSKDSAQQLAQQPGMAWVGQLMSDPTLANKVNWTTLEDASKNWDYKKQGLTPAGAAVVTIVVAYFTAGAASGAGAAVAGGVGATGTTAAVIAGATTAAVSTLASQAAVSFINNQGNLGATLNDLGSSQNVRNLVTAMATGGIVSGLGQAFTVSVNGAQVPLNQVSLGTGASATQVLARNLVSSTANAVVSTAINGGSLGDNLTRAIASGFITTGSALSAFAIGSNTAPGSFANFAGHAIAGCAGGALRANGGCGAGALGAVLGEATALMLNGNRTAQDILANGLLPGTHELASVVGAMGVALAGGDAQQINLAAGAAANAAENNAAGQVRLLADATLRLAHGGWQAVSPAGRAALMRCAASTWCASLPLVAGAVHTINEAQRLASEPSLVDQIPTGYGSPVPLPGTAPTTTPGVAVAGNNSTAGAQLDQVGGNAGGGFGAAGVPTVDPLTYASSPIGSTSPVNTGQGAGVNVTTGSGSQVVVLPPGIDAKGAGHILIGDSPTSGGHLWPGQTGKTPFPQSWTPEKILGEIAGVAGDPNSIRTPGRFGNTDVTGVRNGVEILVHVSPNGRVVSGYPINLPRNP